MVNKGGNSKLCRYTHRCRWPPSFHLRNVRTYIYIYTRYFVLHCSCSNDIFFLSVSPSPIRLIKFISVAPLVRFVTLIALDASCVPATFLRVVCALIALKCSLVVAFVAGGGRGPNEQWIVSITTFPFPVFQYQIDEKISIDFDRFVALAKSSNSFNISIHIVAIYDRDFI